MYEFALVENEIITALCHALPPTWKNISGLNLSVDNEEFLNTLGWYKIQYQEIELNENEVFDNYHYEFVKEPNIVQAIPKKILIDANAIFLENKTRFLNDLRTRRNLLLQECDYTQLLDIQNIKSVEWKNNWIVYRQLLRDLPQQYEGNDVIKLEYVNFPTKPSE